MPFASSFADEQKISYTVTTIYTEERLAEITRLIEQYRATKQRRLLERAMKVWRRAEANRRFAELESPPERLH